MNFPIFCTCQKTMGMVIHCDTHGLLSQVVLKDLSIVVLIDLSLINQLKNYVTGLSFRDIMSSPNKTIRDAVNMTTRNLFRSLKVFPDYIIITGIDQPLTCGMDNAEVFRSIFNYLLSINMSKDVDIEMIQLICEHDARNGVLRNNNNTLGRMYTKTLHYLREKKYLVPSTAKDSGDVSDTNDIDHDDMEESAFVTVINKKDQEIFDPQRTMTCATDVFVRAYNRDTDEQYFVNNDSGMNSSPQRFYMVWVPPATAVE